MASGLCHAIIDLLSFGRSHFDLHQWKDEPSQWLGTQHRELRHEWYNAHGVDWDSDDPFPTKLNGTIEGVAESAGDEEAEKAMSFVGHDFVDYRWDKMSSSMRVHYTAACIGVLQNTEILRTTYGVDIATEQIRRTIDGKEIWEPAPGLKHEHDRLIRYAAKVVQNNSDLRRILH